MNRKRSWQFVCTLLVILVSVAGCMSRSDTKPQTASPKAAPRETEMDQAAREAHAWNERARSITAARAAAWEGREGKPDQAEHLWGRIRETRDAIARLKLPQPEKRLLMEAWFHASFEMGAAAEAEQPAEVDRAIRAAGALCLIAHRIRDKDEALAKQLHTLAGDAVGLISAKEM